MYLKIQKLPLYKPNINLSNSQLLFITNHYGNHIFDTSISISGCDFDYEREMIPYLIIEKYGDIEFHHHLIQEPCKNKKFPPLRLINTEYITNKYNYGNIINLLNISKLRDISLLEHNYINLFQTVFNTYQNSDRYYSNLMSLNEIENVVFISSMLDKYNLENRKIQEKKNNNPFMRNIDCECSKVFKLIDDINENVDINDIKHNKNYLSFLNNIVIAQAKESIPKTSTKPHGSIILDYIKNKPDKPLLNSTDLNKILGIFPDREIIKDNCVLLNSNTITKDDLVSDSDSFKVDISELNNILNTINKINFIIRFVKNKQLNNFIFKEFISISNNCNNNIELPTKKYQNKILSKDLSKYITNLSLVFKFFNDIEEVIVQVFEGIVTIIFKLKDDKTKLLSFNSVISTIATSSVSEED